MQQLRCPSCSRSNAVPTGATVADVRCAGCDGPLDATREVRTFVAVGRDIHGPLPYSAVREGIEKGRFGPDLLYSVEGGPWTRGREVPDLFPTKALRPMSPLPRPRPAGRGTPASVTAMAVLDYLAGSLFLVLALIFLGLARDLGGNAGFGVILFLGLGVGHIVLGVFLVRASQVARALQLVLVGIAVISLVGMVTDGAPVGVALVGLFFAALPVLLLVNSDANDFFAGRSTAPARRGASRPLR